MECLLYNLACRWEEKKRTVSIHQAIYSKIHKHTFILAEYKPLHFTPFFNIFKGLLLIHESFESPPIYNKSPITHSYHHFQFSIRRIPQYCVNSNIQPFNPPYIAVEVFYVLTIFILQFTSVQLTNFWIMIWEGVV